MAAVAMQFLRLQDIGLREEVLLLHLIEGGQSLVAHNGTAYFYDEVEGWMMHTGVVPCSVLARIKDFMLALEGLFLSIPKTTGRTRGALIDVMHDALAGDERSASDILDALRATASLNITSQRPRKGKGKGKAQDSLDADDDLDAPSGMGDDMSWPAHCAFTTARMGVRLTREPLGHKVLSYYVEWCDTPQTVASAVNFVDTCVLFDSGGVNLQHIKKSPCQNVYIYIPHPLLDPVLAEAQSRVQRYLLGVPEGGGGPVGAGSLVCDHLTTG